MCRRRSAWLFLALIALGIGWPVVAVAVSCGDCCEAGTGTCGIPVTGFSLCCFHSASTLPDRPPSCSAPVEGSLMSPADEIAGPPPSPRDILHVPRTFLT